MALGRKPLYGMASPIRPCADKPKILILSHFLCPFEAHGTMTPQVPIDRSRTNNVDLQLPDQRAAFVVDKMLFTSWL